mgnify:CR=1 FL=1
MLYGIESGSAYCSGISEYCEQSSTRYRLRLKPRQKAAKSYIDNAIYDAVGTGVPDATTLAAGKVKLAGDLGGTATAPAVVKIQGIPVSATTPTIGQVLKFDGTSYVPNNSVLTETQTLGLSGSTLTISGTSSSVILPKPIFSQCFTTLRSALA